MKRDPATVQVHIYEDCDVDCEAVNVSKEAGDQIEWHSTGEAFTVNFRSSSPFERCQFRGAGERVQLVRDRLAGTPYATYHYEDSERVNMAMSARSGRQRKALKNLLTSDCSSEFDGRPRTPSACTTRCAGWDFAAICALTRPSPSRSPACRAGRRIPHRKSAARFPDQVCPR